MAPPNGSAAQAPRRPRARKAAPAPAAVEQVDTSFLETLLGYNTRRAWLVVSEVFQQRMAPFALRPVDLSVLSLVGRNPGITSRQLCATLGILPPNLVGLVSALEKRGLISRSPHPHDGRAVGLHLTAEGARLTGEAERTASQLEADIANRLAPSEQRTLLRLLQKIYQRDGS
ncbi:MAG: MarR family winged helix-turn-helix transcriptional regulator [Pseudomonadota bacterium]